MFVVTSEGTRLSPQCMQFAKKWWIYDLTPFHSFWKKTVEGQQSSSKTRNTTHIGVDSNVWGALLKAYKLHLFSPLGSIAVFASDFHSHFKNKISSKNLRETLAIFSRLGLDKIGHLRRLPPHQIQQRFGKAWADFLRGIISPKQASWIWEPFHSKDPVLWSYDFENLCVDGLRIFEEIKQGLEKLAEIHPYFGISQIQIHFILSEVTEEETFDFQFTHRISLKKDLGWILRLLQERLTHMSVSYPVQRICMSLLPADSPESIQLSLFEDRAKILAWKEVCKKLENQNFAVFQPESTASYVPEFSWRRSSALPASASLNAKKNLNFSLHGLRRPLIQEKQPYQISPPEGALKFSERLAWFDEKGERRQRDYFMARTARHWVWVFKNEKDEWFRQGIIE